MTVKTPVTELKLPGSPYWNRHEVASYLHVHPNTVDKLARDGLLTRYRVKGTAVLLYLRSEVKDLVVEITDEVEAQAEIQMDAKANGGVARSPWPRSMQADQPET